MYNEKYQSTIQSNIETYIQIAQEATTNGGDQGKLLELIQHKKLFSPFWLLPCAEELLKISNE